MGTGGLYVGKGFLNGWHLGSGGNLTCGIKKADVHVVDENCSFVAVEKVCTPSFFDFKTSLVRLSPFLTGQGALLTAWSWAKHSCFGSPSSPISSVGSCTL